MIRSLLVCTDGSSYGDVACEYAMDLSVRLRAQLSALHVIDARLLEGPLMADLSNWIGAQPYGAQVPQFRELLNRKGETILEAFAQKCAARNLSPNTLLSSGHPVHVILEEEAKTELLILGQKGEHADWAGHLMGSTVERIVRQSLRPCLVTPDTFRPITKMVVAFDGSGHAAKALHEAIELAQELKVTMNLVTVADGETPEARAAQIIKDGLSLVKAHGFTTESAVVKGIPAEAILEHARSQKGDLIVMGAFGHSRIREMILGSTTAQVVASAGLPVLLVR